jgi:Icc-related predicted phosphoesterase
MLLAYHRPMQILLVSDLHYTLKQLDWVVSVAGEYDLLVVAGDLLDISSIVEPDAQIAVVLEYLARIAAQTPVVACSGNHDLNDRNAVGERTARWLDAARDRGVVVDGSSFSTDDVFVTVCPWWDGPRTREIVDEQLRADSERVDGRDWIWVYHAPADASPTSWTGKRHYGDADLVAWIEQYAPAMVLSGHVHQSPFAADGGWIDRIGATVVCNAGQQRGPIPTCIEIDTTARTARWNSLAGVEERDLETV